MVSGAFSSGRTTSPLAVHSTHKDQASSVCSSRIEFTDLALELQSCIQIFGRPPQAYRSTCNQNSHTSLPTSPSSAYAHTLVSSTYAEFWGDLMGCSFGKR